MPAILSRRWHRQPNGPVAINYMHPLAPYLCFCVPFTEHTSRPRELVTGKLPAFTVNPNATISNGGGQQGYASDANGRLEYGRTPFDTLTDVTGLTVVVQGGFDTNATTNYVIATGENANGFGMQFGFDDASVNTNSLIVTRDNAAGVSSSVDALGASAETRTHTGAFALDGTDGRFFVGAKRTDVTATVSVTAHANRNSYLFGTRSAGNGPGRLTFAYVFRSKLPDSAILEVMREPWGMVKPQQRRIYVNTAAAAGGPTYPQLERGIRGLNRGVALGSFH